MSIKILICGDSYSVTDPDYSGLHWSEKILNHSVDYEILNLAYGGCSNAMISLQLLQGLKLNPDFVIFSFTSPGRYELDKNVSALPSNLTAEELTSYQKQRYTTNNYPMDKEIKNIIDGYRLTASSENFENLKDYFYISLCLTTVKLKNIPFCFSLGGFEYKRDYSNFINSNFVENIINDYVKNQLATNLWYHGQKPKPYFHVDSDEVHTLFANECISYIDKCL
jgi:hypothetical protein